MSTVASFTFNPFSENTYVVYDETKECIIVDPGCYTPDERKRLSTFIQERGLQPVRLINTHCHIDHVLGNKFVATEWGLGLEIHRGEIPVLESLHGVAKMYGIPNVEISPDPASFLEEGDVVSFGNTSYKVLFTPGHSPASICLYCEADAYVLAGDVLFEDSIGRYDLPGGNLETLMNSIHTQLMTLPQVTKVYPGHGNSTTIGKEKRYNPFLL